MINLFISSNSKEALKWQHILKEWCVAHRVINDSSFVVPEIKDGKKHAVGATAINQFLEEYKISLDEWNDCRCDKWMDT